MFETPTLVMRGAADGRVNRLFASMPHRHVFIVPDAGHAAYFHQPRLFMTVLLNFLDYVHR